MCGRCGASTDWYCSRETAIAAWNTRADDAPEQPVDNAQADSREQLEEAMRNVIRDALMNLKTAIMCCVEQGMDVLSFDEREFVDFEPEEYVDEYLLRAMRLLDRQASITERELCDRCSPYATAKDYLDTIDSLTAERDEWKTKCETREVAYKQADAERKRYSEQIDELFAERDYWKDQVHKCAIEAVKPGGYTAGIMRYPRTDGYCEPSLIVTDAIVSLKDFYADEKRVNDKLTAERDELRDKLDEKQHVCDVQRESFRKMEKLLADANAADFTAKKDEIERLRVQVAELKAENRDLCMKVYGAPF
jgi:polyhydroxyalkanoate synthesis regulator phasin